MLTVTDRSGNGMGVGFVQSADVSYVFTGVGVSPSARVKNTFNYSLKGTFVGTFYLERSLDNGTTWGRKTALGTTYEFTAPCEEVDSDAQYALYRWRCSAYTSGSATAEISQ